FSENCRSHRTARLLSTFEDRRLASAPGADCGYTKTVCSAEPGPGNPSRLCGHWRAARALEKQCRAHQVALRLLAVPENCAPSSPATASSRPLLKRSAQDRSGS